MIFQNLAALFRKIFRKTRNFTYQFVLERTPLFLKRTDQSKERFEVHRLEIRLANLLVLSTDQKTHRLEILRGYYPSQMKLIVEVAEKVCRHEFDLLGSGPIQFKSIDWHCDFKSGHRFDPQAFYTQIKPASFPGGYDIKVPWELSRCQHLIWLGQAYWLTDDEKYPQEFVRQLLDWIEKNPHPWGVNWACAMEVAIRAVNWVWAYAFLASSQSLTEKFKEAFFGSLRLHGKHIWANLENIGRTNNHYIANLVGLLYLGLLCPDLKEAKHWRDFSLRELEKEMFKQVHADGVCFEASTSYHRLTTEMFLSAVYIARMCGCSFSSPFMERLQKMLEFIRDTTKPDGTMPLVGDHDNGRLHRFKVWHPPEREWIDFRYLLAIGAVLFDREDFALAAGDQWEEAIWLFGGEVKPYLEHSRYPKTNLELRSCAYPDGGFYIMRHEDTYVLIRSAANPQGLLSHAHNDSLSFEFYFKGVTWFADPGCFVYTADYEARNALRSTYAHNTVVVDGQEQSLFDPKNAFSSLGKNNLKVLRWKETADYALFAGQLNGCLRDRLRVVHRRMFVLLRRPRMLLFVTDEVWGGEDHRVEFLLHLGDAKVERVLMDEVILISHLETERLVILNLREQRMKWQVAESWRSTGYGHKVANQTLCSRGFGPSPFYSSYVVVELQDGEAFEEVEDQTRLIYNEFIRDRFVLVENS